MHIVTKEAHIDLYIRVTCISYPFIKEDYFSQIKRLGYNYSVYKATYFIDKCVVLVPAGLLGPLPDSQAVNVIIAITSNNI